MKYFKNIALFITIVFTFFIGFSIINAGVPSRGENLSPTAKNNTSIRYLFVYDYELSPAFDPNVYEYDIIAPPKTDSVKLTYRTGSLYSNVSVDQTDNLTNGSVVIVTVTAQDGTKRDYKFTLRYSNSKLLYTILIVLIIIILILAITALVLYILWKKGIIKITKKEKKNIGTQNYVN
ncbi:MAG: cadherin-like beta sandwich domain-containing protein [Bacilli bacterium]|nr:cadherin-like beta sandwich domain-containing protein [Bacilli bacterium]